MGEGIQAGSPRPSTGSRQLRVAVSDPLPLFRYGVMTALDGLATFQDAPDDPRLWSWEPEPSLLLMTVSEPQDWPLLSEMSTRTSRPSSGPGPVTQSTLVVAMLDVPDTANYVRAITAGASAALPRRVSAERLRAVVQATLDGDTVLPTAVVRALAHEGAIEGGPSSTEPTAQERQWLMALAKGERVAQLAESAGYSERMMFRLLRGMYTRLGAEGRTAALMLARDHGWI
jgi:DNA-binding NarL/FixJ family response regulator